jgi:hypothetical protein
MTKFGFLCHGRFIPALLALLVVYGADFALESDRLAFPIQEAFIVMIWCIVLTTSDAIVHIHIMKAIVCTISSGGGPHVVDGLIRRELIVVDSQAVLLRISVRE